MTEMNATESSEKKSLNFIEQIVEKDLKEGKNGGKYRPGSRPNRTDTYTSAMPKPSAWTSASPRNTEAYATCASTIPTPRRKTWNT